VPKKLECSIFLLARSSIFCSLLSRGMFCFPCCFCMHFMFPIWNYIHLSSRGTTPLFGLHGEWFFLTFQEIFASWTHKTDHFQMIHTQTGIPFNSMLFFDDEDRNIQSVKTKLSCYPCLLILWVGCLKLVFFFVMNRQFPCLPISLCEQVSKMGVTSILVGDGVNLGALRQGLTEFSQNASKSEKNKQRWQKYSQNPSSSENKDEDWTFCTCANGTGD